MFHSQNRLGSAWLVLIGILVTVLIYWPGLHGGFFFDDYPNIVDNKGILLDDLAFASLKAASLSGVSGSFGRPVSQLSFALNQYLNGFDPFFFKLTNLIIHCLNSILVYFLAVQLFKGLHTKFRGTEVGRFAAGVAFVWMIHPIQLTSVLYVVQRMTSISASFLLAALLLHVWVRREDSVDGRGLLLLLLAWGMLWPLSVLSKETGALLPGFVLAYELIIRRAATGQLDVVGRMAKYLLVASFLFVPLYLLSPFATWIFSGYEIRPFTLGERLMTEARILWEYLRLIFFPSMEAFGLHHDDIPLSNGLLSPWTTFPAIIGVVILAISSFLLRQRLPLVAFGIAWFFIGHGLESTFIPLELVHEHRNYLPLLGACIALVGVINHLTERPGAQRTIGITVVSALLVYFGLLTALRSEMFRNEQIRIQLEAQHHPDSARANYEVGRAFAGVYDQDRSNEIVLSLARKHFERATTFDQSYKMGYLGLLILDCGASERVDPSVIDALALRLYETPFTPEDRTLMGAISSMLVRGTLCLTREEFEKLFSAAVKNPRTSPDAIVSLHVWLADYLWMVSKDLPAAKNALKKALKIQPLDPSIRFKWAQLVYIAGEKDEARQLLHELQGKPFSPVEQKEFDRLIDLDASQK